MPPTASTTLPRSGFPRRRWLIACLLGFGVLVNYFDRVNLSVSYSGLVDTFHISSVTFGYLSAAYAWTYALCQIPVGIILDRFGIRRVNRVTIALWGLASLGSAVTPGIGGFYAARFLLGVGEAPTFPANAKAVGKWFPPNERSMATAVSDSCAKLASAIGVPIIGIILLRVGWRWSFAITGFVSFFFLLLFWLIYNDPEDDPHVTPEELQALRDSQPVAATSAAQESIGSLARNRKVLGLALGFSAYNYTFALLLTWLPHYLSEALHIDLLHSFLYTGVPWLVATVTDLLIGGLLVDTLLKRGYDGNRVRKTVIVIGMTCGLGIFGAGSAHTATSALIWISLSIGGLAATAPVGWSIASLIAPGNSVGRVGGIVNFVTQLSGMAAAVVTGYLVRDGRSFAAAFAVATAYLLLGILGYTVILGRIEPIGATTSPAAV